MIRRIPQDHTWTGIYPGDFRGDLWKTRNIDLDRSEGFIALSQRMERIEDSSEITDLGGTEVRAFIRTDADCVNRYWALNANALFKTDSDGSTNSPSEDWDSESLDSAPTSQLRDFTVHAKDSRADSGKDKLIVTTDSDVWVLNDTGNNTWTGNWWVTKHSQPALNVSAVYHPIEYFPFTKISLIGDGNLIHTISRPSDTQNDTVTYARLRLPPKQHVGHIFTTPERAWFLCNNVNTDGNGAIVEWDGFSQSYNRIHDLYNQGFLSGINYKGSPIVLNSKGQFLEFTGNGFAPMVRNGQLVQLPIAEKTGGTMLLSNPRGMVVGEDGLIYVNVDVGDQSIRLGKSSGGIWCLNPLTGRLYNKYSLGRYGDSLDYGQEDISTPGGLLWVPSAEEITGATGIARNLLAGGSILAPGTQGGIWLQEDITEQSAQRGYFITRFISAEEVLEFWDTAWVRFRRFFSSSGNSIVLKAKGTRSLVQQNGSSLSATITWTSTSTFTVTHSASDDAMQIGDEVEIVQGVNAGVLAHITIISGAHGALQTVTIDETVTTASSTSFAIFDRWKKIGTITSTTTSHQKLNIGIDSSFIQFKVELRGVPNELEIQDLTVVSNPSLSI